MGGWPAARSKGLHCPEVSQVRKRKLKRLLALAETQALAKDQEYMPVVTERDRLRREVSELKHQLTQVPVGVQAKVEVRCIVNGISAKYPVLSVQSVHGHTTIMIDNKPI